MSVSVFSEMIYPTYVRRRYEVILTDNLGTDHTYVLGMYNHQPDNDGSDVEAQQIASLKSSDAEAASETDDEIVEKDYASREQIALAYLRKAYSIEDSYRSYVKFNLFNNYRLSKGWSIAQVSAGLASEGLTQEEWDLMVARYVYLSLPARVTVMEDYQTVLNGDPRT